MMKNKKMKQMNNFAPVKELKALEKAEEKALRKKLNKL